MNVNCIRTGFVEPDGQQSEHRGAAYGGEETSPVVPHREVHGGYFDAEQHAADGRSETARHAHRTSRGQHFRVPGLVLIDPFERSDHFRQKGGRYAGDVHERTLRNPTCVYVLCVVLRLKSEIGALANI